MQRREVVRQSQEKLRQADPRLVPDGWWGARTESVFQKAEPALQKSVTDFALAYGFSLDALRLPSVLAARKGNWIPEDKARSLADRAAFIAGIPAEWLHFMLEQEPRVRRVAEGREFDAESIAPSGLFRGLFQMGEPAWVDASKVFPEIGAYSNWRDPWLNALAAAGFAKANISYARNIHGYRGEFTKELIYAMHNQGHGFLASARKGGIGRWADGQSQKAQAVLRTAAYQVGATLS